MSNVNMELSSIPHAHYTMAMLPGNLRKEGSDSVCHPDKMPRRTRNIFASLLFFCTFFVHMYFIRNKLQNKFLRYDDFQNFVANPLITSEIDLNTIFLEVWMPKSVLLGVYEPVSQLIKTIVVVLIGNSRFIHLTLSVFLFSLSISLMFLNVIIMLEKANASETANRSKTKALKREVSTNLLIHFHLFLLLGISAKRVEVLAWASCGGYSNALFLLTFGIHYYVSGKKNGKAVFLVFYILAVLSKAVAIPVILFPFVFDYITEGAVIINNTLLFFYATATAFLMFAIVAANKAPTTTSITPSVDLFQQYQDIVARALHSCKFYIYGSYVSFTDFCVHYFMPTRIESTKIDPSCLISSGLEKYDVLNILLSLAAVFCFGLMKHLILYVIGVIIITSPVIAMSALQTHGAENGGIVHVRYTLLAEVIVTYPVLSFAVERLLCTNNAVGQGSKPIKGRTLASPIRKFILGAMFALILSSFGRLGGEYEKWENTVTLWSDAIQKNTDDSYAHHGLAEELVQRCTGSHGVHAKHCTMDILQDALGHISKSLSLKVTSNSLHNNAMIYGMLLDKCSMTYDYVCIREHFGASTKAIRNRTKLESVLDNLISLFAAPGESFRRNTKFIETLIQDFSHFVSRRTRASENGYKNLDVVYFAFGKFYHLRKQYSKAMLQYQRAIAINNQSSQVFANQGEVIRRINDIDNDLSKQSYKEALKLDPSNVDALYGMGILNYEEKRFKEALKYFQLIQKMAPNDLSSLYTYGVIMSKVDLERSIEIFEDLEAKCDKNMELRAKVQKKLRALRSIP